MVAMVGVIWAYDGWVNSSELAEEITDPGRTIPRSLLLGMVVLIGTYLSMTLVYHLVLSMSEEPPRRQSDRGGGVLAAANPGPARVDGGIAGRDVLDLDCAERQCGSRGPAPISQWHVTACFRSARSGPSSIQNPGECDHRTGRVVDHDHHRRHNPESLGRSHQLSPSVESRLERHSTKRRCTTSSTITLFSAAPSSAP